MAETHYRYSIIIPHRNIPDLLERCIRSIPTRDDVQVIIVDDCSDDKYQSQLRILEQAHRNMVFIYCSEKGGAGRARNIGMSQSNGDYLIFADADDFFSNIFSNILDSYSDATEDIIYFRNHHVLSRTPNISINHSDWIDNIFDRFVNTHDFSEIICSIYTPWAKFFRREFIISNNLHFDEAPIANDVIFVVSAGCLAKTRLVAQERIYYYTERKGSITDSYSKGTEGLRIRTEVCFRAQKIMNQYGYKIRIMPLSVFLHKAYHFDKCLYRKYLKRIPEVYNSIWDAFFQMRCLENSFMEKLTLYIHSFIWFLFG